MMESLRTFCIGSWPPLNAGTLRLSRLNIYSGLYIEFHKFRILIDPAKILPQVESLLEPDLILVSHESMDHFDADICLKLLQKEQTCLVGSWGVIVALTDHLAADDPRWGRIFTGIPGTSFKFGDLIVNIEESIHCEYAVPVFFDIRDTMTGFRIIDAVDTEITPRMRDHAIAPGPDILVVPMGIALAANASQAWEMVQLLRPVKVFANHFTTEQDEFIALAQDHYESDKLIILSWYNGVTLKGPDPAFGTQPVISYEQNLTCPEVAGSLAEWIRKPPAEDTLISHLETATNPNSVSVILYFLARNALMGHATSQTMAALKKVKNNCVSTDQEFLTASFLLALGATAGSLTEDVLSELTSLKKLLSPGRAYVDYWIIESWGRSAKNQKLDKAVIRLLEQIAEDTELFSCIGVRRKIMWEIHRIVGLGHLWAGLKPFLMHGHADQNPDVRLLTYKILPRCHSIFEDISSLLAHGLNDEHEDVLEWVIISHIELFDSLTPDQRKHVSVRLPGLLTYPNYHVREKANILSEIMGIS